MRKSAVFVAALLVFGQVTMAHAEETETCAKVSAVIERVVEKYPELGEPGFDTRMGIMKIGTRAGVAFAYASDDGWTEEELQPLVALRDLREPDEDGRTISTEEAPDLAYEHASALVQVLKTRCPDSKLADLKAVRSPTN